MLILIIDYLNMKACYYQKTKFKYSSISSFSRRRLSDIKNYSICVLSVIDLKNHCVYLRSVLICRLVNLQVFHLHITIKRIRFVFNDMRAWVNILYF